MCAVANLKRSSSCANCREALLLNYVISSCATVMTCSYRQLKMIEINAYKIETDVYSPRSPGETQADAPRRKKRRVWETPRGEFRQHGRKVIRE